MKKIKLSYFPYKFDRGPVSAVAVDQPLNAGNCRAAIQEYFWVAKSIYFAPKQLLNPQGILQTGRFIKQGPSADFFERLDPGMVIYAEAILDKNGVLVDKSPAAFAEHNDYLIALHTAIFLGDIAGSRAIMPGVRLPEDGQPSLWHATAVDGASGVWTIEQFLRFYKPVAAKQFV